MMLVSLLTSGIPGIEIPYTPQADNYVAALLLLCFLISAFTLAHCQKYLLLQLRWFVFHKERISIFASSTMVDVRYLMLLFLQTCILVSTYAFAVSTDLFPTLPDSYPVYLTLGLYLVGSILYFTFKWLLYSFVGWMFFDKNRTSMWVDSYQSLIYLSGFVLFPFVLLSIYFDFQFKTLVIIGLLLLAIAKTLMFYKWIKLFSNTLSDFFLLILYFCALEIVPCLIVYSGLIKVNDLLTIKL